MPVRSLSSSVLVWPDLKRVDTAVRSWATEQASKREDVIAIGYFGSYARGDWGVGSDLDLVVLLSTAREPFIYRGRSWDTLSLPVPADLLVYTSEEWDSLAAQRGTLPAAVRAEVTWIYRRQR